MQKGSKEKGHISNFNRSINLKEVTEGHLLKGKGVHIKQGKGHGVLIGGTYAEDEDEGAPPTEQRGHLSK